MTVYCSDIPPALARFLGDVSGLAEFVSDKVSSGGIMRSLSVGF